LKDFLQNQYGYQGHKPAQSARPEKTYFDEEYVDAVQQYIDHVTKPLADQGVASIEWLGTRKEALKNGILTLSDTINEAQEDRAHYEVTQFGETVDAAMHASAELAADLLGDIEAKNEGIQGTLEDLNHTYYGYQDATGYRYKLQNQLHHQRVAFEQAVEAAWVTWTQSRELALDTAEATAGQAGLDFEAFLATKLGEWDQQAAAARADLADRIAAKGEALKSAAQDATRAFAEKQAYKRHYIAGLQDYHKKERLTAKVDLEDQLYAEAVKGIWTGFQNETDVATEWLENFLGLQRDYLTEAQDVIGEALAEALAGEIGRLGEALGEIGDAFFEHKHNHVVSLMDALVHYGYADYQEGYEPVFVHEDEHVDNFSDAYPDVAVGSEVDLGPSVHESEEEDVEVFSSLSSVEEFSSHDDVSSISDVVVLDSLDSEDEVSYIEPSVESESTVVISESTVESESTVVLPSIESESTVVVSEPTVVSESTIVLPSIVSESTHTVVYSEPTYYSPTSVTTYVEPESESTYYPPTPSTVSSHSSESSHSHPHDSHDSYDHHHSVQYDNVKPYRPGHQSRAPPSYPMHEVDEHDDDHHDSVSSHDSHSSSSHADVEINIYNGVGGNTVMGFGGGNVDCAPRTGECRPQCPEVVFNAIDDSVHFVWDEDVANCNDYPENTWLTLYSPDSIGQ
jgi:hypothetical protein